MDPIKAMLSTIVDLSPTNLFELIIANASLNLLEKKIVNSLFLELM